MESTFRILQIILLVSVLFHLVICRRGNKINDQSAQIQGLVEGSNREPSLKEHWEMIRGLVEGSGDHPDFKEGSAGHSSLTERWKGISKITSDPLYDRKMELMTSRQNLKPDTETDLTLVEQWKQYKAADVEIIRNDSTTHCGRTYAIREGKRDFTLKKSENECKHTFAGSKTDRCTVAIRCQGKLNDSGRFPRCSNDYLRIYDSTDGKQQLCGPRDFNGIPQVPRNGGTDLFIEYQVSSESAECSVFCTEDFGYYYLEELPQELPKNTEYERLTEEDCVCGMQNTSESGRVVNGKEAHEFEFPWIGTLVLRHSRRSFCGAVLINHRYALSAAHCFEDELFIHAPENKTQLIFHSHVMIQGNLNTLEEFLDNLRQSLRLDIREKSFRTDIEDITIHPNYHPYFLDYDLAILKLTKPINFKKRKDILPICLPEVSDSFHEATKEVMTVAGWGRTNSRIDIGSKTLQKLSMNTAKCALGLSSRRHFCAGFVEGGKGACKGDSGGPLITRLEGEADNRFILTGIASGANKNDCTAAGFPLLYTNVQELVQWVYYHTQDGVFCKTDPHTKYRLNHDPKTGEGQPNSERGRPNTEPERPNTDPERPNTERGRPNKVRGRHNKGRGRTFDTEDLSSGENLQPAKTDILRFNSDLQEIGCNSYRSLNKNDSLTFELNSSDQACRYIFAGSTNERCTVAFICKGKLSNNAKSTSCNNDADFIEVYDTNNGRERLCGSSEFDNIPKVARGNGTDLFVSYKASSDTAVCTVLCAEDVKDDTDNMRQPIPLSQNRNYQDG